MSEIKINKQFFFLANAWKWDCCYISVWAIPGFIISLISHSSGGLLQCLFSWRNQMPLIYLYSTHSIRTHYDLQVALQKCNAWRLCLEMFSFYCPCFSRSPPLFTVPPRLAAQLKVYFDWLVSVSIRDIVAVFEIPLKYSKCQCKSFFKMVETAFVGVKVIKIGLIWGLF